MHQLYKTGSKAVRRGLLLQVDRFEDEASISVAAGARGRHHRSESRRGHVERIDFDVNRERPHGKRLAQGSHLWLRHAGRAVPCLGLRVDRLLRLGRVLHPCRDQAPPQHARFRLLASGMRRTIATGCEGAMLYLGLSGMFRETGISRTDVQPES